MKHKSQEFAPASKIQHRSLSEGYRTRLVFKYLVVYGTTLFFFLVLDFIWLGWLAKSFYDDQLGMLLRQQIVWPAAFGFYLIYIVGIIIFCILPALHRMSLRYAIIMGGLYGFFTYATYELTNYALIRDWPATLVPVDIAWGTLLCAAVSSLGYGVGLKLKTGS